MHFFLMSRAFHFHTEDVKQKRIHSGVDVVRIKKKPMKIFSVPVLYAKAIMKREEKDASGTENKKT